MASVDAFLCAPAAASHEGPDVALGSVRQRMLERLRQGPATLRDLARELRLTEAVAADHLRHALRSLGPGEQVGGSPAECRACGFVFRKRERVRAPGRCPRCRSERIDPAVFRIERRG
jgi:predicted Zn-ribbon and HTH transcriptional regulator